MALRPCRHVFLCFLNKFIFSNDKSNTCSLQEKQTHFYIFLPLLYICQSSASQGTGRGVSIPTQLRIHYTSKQLTSSQRWVHTHSLTCSQSYSGTGRLSKKRRHGNKATAVSIYWMLTKRPGLYYSTLHALMYFILLPIPSEETESTAFTTVLHQPTGAPAFDQTSLACLARADANLDSRGRA